MKFSYQALPWNIIFGVDALDGIDNALDALGFDRALLLTTPNQTADGTRVAELLGSRCAGHFDQAVMHVPIECVVNAEAAARKLNADCTVAIGGGSTTGLGKALALRADLPNIVIPTSYAGSEMTDIWGITEGGRKTTGRDNRVVPTLTIYDPKLTLSLPPAFAASSGLNAMAQAAVNVASNDINPLVRTMALEAVRRLASSLPRILAKPHDLDARTDALLGASLAGGALGTGTTGLHHRLCHTFGGTFNTPHAETHTVLLPHSIAFNAAATAEGTALLADALGNKNAADGIFDLAKQLKAPSSLRELGVNETDLDKAIEISMASPLSNPATISEENLRLLLDDAFHGRQPRKYA